MFKYLWIIILVTPILIFIYYTINAIRESFNDAIHYAERDDSSKDIKLILRKTWRYFEKDHKVLCTFWACLILFGIVSLFATSLAAYLSIIK